MAVDYVDLLEQLTLETAGLTGVLTELTESQWRAPSAADRWSVADQVSHLAFFDDAVCSALTDPETFRDEAAALMADGMDFPDRIAARYRELSTDELLAWFQAARERSLDAFRAVPADLRTPWFGVEMSAASSVTARLMETWAHGQDVYDAVGIAHPPSRAWRSIAHLGIGSFAFAYRNNGLAVPDAPIRVHLDAPGGEQWTWGPDDAADSITGPAEDFVFVVTQRRNIIDTALTVTGDAAAGWMKIAQAFAGAPTTGRRPRTTTQTGALT